MSKSTVRKATAAAAESPCVSTREKHFPGSAFLNEVSLAGYEVSFRYEVPNGMKCAPAHKRDTSLHLELQLNTSFRRSDTSYAEHTSLCILGVTSMKENKLMDLSMEFAIKTIELVKSLKDKKETIISNQIGRSGTSIGANIREAQYAHGKADFIAKLQIALKEANETGYWLELLYKTNYIDEGYYHQMDTLCTNIRVLLISSVKTTKSNQ